MYNYLDKKDVCIGVFGDLMLDEYMIGDCTRISPEAPVPVFNFVNQEFRAGGAANVAINLSRFDAKVIISGILGSDYPGEKIKIILQENKIIDRTVSSNRIKTIVKCRVVSRGQQILRIDSEDPSNIISKISEKKIVDLAPSIIADADVLILSDYAKGSISDPQKIIGMAKQANVPVLVDPKGQSFEQYSGAFLLTPNFSEFTEVVGSVSSTEDMLERARDCISMYDLNALVITRGDKGVTLVTPEHHYTHSSEAKEVFDVTGAGDTFISTLAYCIGLGISLEDAVRISNKAASMVVSKFGTAALDSSEIDLIFRSNEPTSHMALHDKILDTKESMQMLHSKYKNKKITATNGCFDILHPGHIKLLENAKKFGDILVVAINTDDSIKRLKGEYRPINSLEDRMLVLGALECVDYLIPFDDDTPIQVYEKLRPDILVKGDDYKIEDIVGADLVLGYGGRVETIALVPEYSTSKIIEAIKDKKP